MTTDQFKQLLQIRFQMTETVLANKAREYAANADRLHNFKVCAAMTGETPAQVCVGFMVKHLASIFDIVNAAKSHPPNDALIDEKIGDAINYLILLEAILKEAAP